jgi:hypothetical protein
MLFGRKKLNIADGAMPQVTDETIVKSWSRERLRKLEIVLTDEFFAGLMDVLNLIAEMIRSSSILEEFTQALIIFVGFNKFDVMLILLVQEGYVTAMGWEINHRLRCITESLKGSRCIFYRVSNIANVI